MAKFSDIVGQEELKQHIHNAIEMDKVSHAYIISGERNAGKEFIARLFAMTLRKGGYGAVRRVPFLQTGGKP